MPAQYKLSASSTQQSAGQAESNRQKAENSKKGFTLIELMVSIAIIAVLAAVGLVVYTTAQKSGRISKRVQDLKAIQTALELFKTTNGFYPNVTAAGTFVCLDSLVAPNSLVPTFMPQIPRDPLQSAAGDANCYHYTSDVGGGGPTATMYKVKTRTTEMTSTDFAQQLVLIDPERDGGTVDDNCAIQTTNITAWAVYTTVNTACNY
jgi:prepilin-type N-terminal cleavage/methylation domain-containing protein